MKEKMGFPIAKKKYCFDDITIWEIDEDSKNNITSVEFSIYGV